MKVFINLESTVTSADGTKDRIPHSGNGMLTCQNSTLRLSFPISGIMQTLIYDKNTPHHLELQRGSDRLEFDTSLSETDGRFQTEYFVIFPKIRTHTLRVDLTESGGSILLSYDLSLEGEIQHFHMEIEVKKTA